LPWDTESCVQPFGNPLSDSEYGKLALVIATPQEFTQTALSYLVLLFFQVGFFLILPVENWP
jgi:hypothetical protein